MIIPMHRDDYEKLSILENRQNVEVGLVPTQNTDSTQITGQPQVEHSEIPIYRGVAPTEIQNCPKLLT